MTILLTWYPYNHSSDWHIPYFECLLKEGNSEAGRSKGNKAQPVMSITGQCGVPVHAHTISERKVSLLDFKHEFLKKGIESGD
jgi:hypothetical protein